MFDVEKVRRMTEEFEQFAQAYEEIFLTPEFLTGDTIALFHRLKINVRALILDEPSKSKDKALLSPRQELTVRKVIFDESSKPIDTDESFWRNPLHKEFRKLPVLKTSEAAKNFSERTGIITVVKKPLPFFRTELPFIVNGRRMNIPVFVLAPDEISAIYSRLTVWQTLQRYEEDGSEGCTCAHSFAEKFAQGLSSFLNSEIQTLKFQFLNEPQLNSRYDFDDAAIVIQGPIVYENNYTAATVKLYRKIYPNVPIVVSTWTDSATDDFREVCRENSVVLLENVPPKIPGSFNVNMQLESSLRGVNFVREKTAAKFVLKTRTDNRLNKVDFLSHFRNLIRLFPPFGDKLRGRIIQLGIEKWLPFRTIDFLAFGYVEDISKLYGIKRHSGENIAPTYLKKHGRRFFGLQKIIASNSTPCNYIPTASTKKLRQLNNITRRMHEIESHIMKTFYEENIGAIDYDKFVETGWKFLRDYLVIVGSFEVCLDWFKYEDVRYENDAGGVTFSRWLDLYMNHELGWV